MQIKFNDGGPATYFLISGLNSDISGLGVQIF